MTNASLPTITAAPGLPKDADVLAEAEAEARAASVGYVLVEIGRAHV